MQTAVDETGEAVARAQVDEPGRTNALTIGSSSAEKFYGPIRGQGHTMAANAALDEVWGGIGGGEGEVSG